MKNKINVSPVIKEKAFALFNEIQTFFIALNLINFCQQKVVFVGLNIVFYNYH